MNERHRIDEIIERLHAVQQELHEELDRLLEEKREQFRYSLRRGRVVFESGVKRWHREHRTGIWRFLGKAPVTYILSAPIIYAMIVPLALLDLSVTLYQHICFRIYGIPRVSRRAYLVIDRHELAYLNAIEKFNCVYCGYGNGLIEYAREITARTEQYWCPIKHARRTPDPHHRMQRFLDYGDAATWREGLQALRKEFGKGAGEDPAPHGSSSAE